MSAHSHNHSHDTHTHDHKLSEHNDHDHRHSLWEQIAEALHIPGYSHAHAQLVEDSVLYHNDLAIRTAWQAFLVIAVTVALQLAVYALSGSVALLGDLVHNLGDALSSIPLLLAFWLAKRKPTRRYTYGYGRAEDVAELLIVASIAFSAFYILWEAIQHLKHQHIHNLGWVSLASLIGFLGNEGVALLEIRIGRKIGSAALVTHGTHARTDGLTSLAVLVAAVLTGLGFPIADPIIGILIAVMIVFIARDAIITTWYRLLDAVDPAVVDVDKVERVITACSDVKEISRLQMRWVGHELHAEIVLAVDSQLTRQQVDMLIESIKHNLHHEVGAISQTTITVYS